MARQNAQEKVEQKANELADAVAEAKAQQKPMTPRLVKFNHPDPSAVLFYTTDGTYPIPNRAQVYEAPFYVYEDTLVKFVALVDKDVSPVVERFYNVQ